MNLRRYLVVQARLDEAFQLARQAIGRTPEVAYFHYVLSLVPASEEGLRSAKVLIASCTSCFAENYAPFTREA